MSAECLFNAWTAETRIAAIGYAMQPENWSAFTLFQLALQNNLRVLTVETPDHFRHSMPIQLRSRIKVIFSWSFEFLAEIELIVHPVETFCKFARQETLASSTSEPHGEPDRLIFCQHQPS